MKFTTLVTLALSAASVLAAPAGELEARACTDVYVYFARGTTETPTLGSVVGPGLSSGVSTRVRAKGKTVTFTGIAYPATVEGYLAGGDAGGARTMANAVVSAAASCPNAKIFISGYSQGAQVAHLAARQLSSANQNRITGVVTFGDPYKNTALPGSLQSRRKTYCNVGDLICSGLPTILYPHLTYGSDTGNAAAWIADRV